MKAWKAAGIFLILTIAGYALAAESGKKHGHAPSMDRQHQAMSLAAQYWEACKQGLKGGNFDGAGRSLRNLQKALRDLERYKPHKNGARTEEFRELAHSFNENLARLAKAVNKRASTAAQSLADAADKGCLQCHKDFR